MRRLKFILLIIIVVSLYGCAISDYRVTPIDKRTNNLSNTIFLHSSATYLNYVGGADYSICYWNVSNKTYKYVRLTVVAYNAVGDSVYCEIKDKCSANLLITGPIKPLKKSSNNTGNNLNYASWDAVLYNYSIKKLVLTKVEIEWMNGETITIEQPDLMYVCQQHN